MARVKLLAAAGIAAFVLALLVTMPARVAYHWFAPAELKLSGISGSVWNGRAAEGAAGGIYFADLAWRFRPASLLTGRAACSVSARPAGGLLEAEVAIGLGGGSMRLRDLEAALPLDIFSSVVPMEGVDGNLGLDFARVAFEDGFPTDAEGTLRIMNLVLRPLSGRALGDYRAILQTGDDGITGTVEDVSGVLDLAGTAVLRRDRSYTFSGQVAATPDAPSAVVEQLRFLGSPDAQGRREFRFEGSL
jgi:general secretion pathway protein N